MPITYDHKTGYFMRGNVRVFLTETGAYQFAGWMLSAGTNGQARVRLNLQSFAKRSHAECFRESIDQS